MPAPGTRGQDPYVLVPAAATAHLLAFLTFYPLAGPGACAFALLPIAAAGWVWGRVAGAAAGVAAVLLNAALLRLADGPGWWDAAVAAGGYAGGLTGVVVGVAVGWARARVTRAEAAARESEGRYRAVVEQAADAILVFEPGGRIIDANRRACESLGYALGELLRLTVADVEADPAARARELAPGDTDTIPGRHRRRNGTTFPVEVRVGSLETGGRPMRVALVRDVTDRERAEAALREREELLRQVIAHIPAGVFWKDRDSVLRGCNEQFARDHGFGSPSEVVGKTDMDLPVAPAEAARFAADDRRVMATGEQVLNAEEAQSRPGGKAYLLTSKVPLRDAAGAVTGVLGVYQDITERKRLEDQLRHTQKMDAVGRLAGGVAHDFNNLLTVINGFSDIALEALPDDNPARELIAEVRKAGDRAAGLTRQLLTFGRRSGTDPRLVDPNDLIRDTQGMLRRLIGEDIVLSVALAPDPGRVWADPDQVQQVLLNLAVNARDAMPAGGRLTIETQAVTLDEEYTRSRPDVAPGGYVLLAVTDTGCGMDAVTLARAFEPFYTTKEVGKGTGLGLSTVHGIVKQAGGHVAVYSEPGRGSAFKVYLPRAPEGVEPDLVGEPAAAPDPVPRGVETVLLVEDEPAVRALARGVLDGCGYAVLEAADGREALRVAGDHPGPIDLLVSDVVMPHMGGQELADLLRATTPGLRVLFVSGYTDRAVFRHELLAAGSTFLQKPFSPAALARRVREVLDAGADGVAAGADPGWVAGDTDRDE